MNCPICNAWTTVNDTRNKEDYTTRRRECANGHTFTTEERVNARRIKSVVAVHKARPEANAKAIKTGV
jgi:transcriptional regulator NrdR family protein